MSKLLLYTALISYLIITNSASHSIDVCCKGSNYKIDNNAWDNFRGNHDDCHKESCKPPSKPPSKNPTKNPVKPPSIIVTKNPTKNPVKPPSIIVTKNPTKNPVKPPSIIVTKNPLPPYTKNPSPKPSIFKTFSPLPTPTYMPSSIHDTGCSKMYVSQCNEHVKSCKLIYNFNTCDKYPNQVVIYDTFNNNTWLCI